MSEHTWEGAISRYLGQRPEDLPTVEECEAAARHALSVGYQRVTVTGEQDDDAGSVRPDEEPTP